MATFLFLKSVLATFRAICMQVLSKSWLSFGTNRKITIRTAPSAADLEATSFRFEGKGDAESAPWNLICETVEKSKDRKAGFDRVRSILRPHQQWHCRLCERSFESAKEAEPTPEIHAILNVLKAGETV